FDRGDAAEINGQTADDIEAVVVVSEAQNVDRVDVLTLVQAAANPEFIARAELITQAQRLAVLRAISVAIEDLAGRWAGALVDVFEVVARAVETRTEAIELLIVAGVADDLVIHVRRHRGGRHRVRRPTILVPATEGTAAIDIPVALDIDTTVTADGEVL